MTATPVRYVPSRYVSMAFDDDSALIVNSSRTGAIGVIPSDQAEAARRMLLPAAVTLSPLSGIAADLAQGGLLVPEYFDEAQMVHDSYLRRYDQGNLHLIIMPTEDCNFRCVYCYESFLRGEMASQVRNAIKEFVLSQSELRTLNVQFFGGEPFLASATVLDLMDWFHQHSAQQGISLIAGATTNGSLLVPEIADRIIPQGCNHFQITLDGTEADHNARRHGRDGEETFAAIIQNLRYLRQSSLDFTVMLRHNFDPETLSRLDRYIDMIAAEFSGDSRFRTHFEAIGRWGGANDEDLDVCEGRSAPRAILRARRMAAEAGFRDEMTRRSMGPDGFVCYAADPRSFVIGSDGTVYKCTIELDYHDRNKVGKLREDGVMEINWERMALWCETDGMESEKKCTTCWFSPSCHGAICPKEWMDDNDVACPPAKQTIHDTLKFVRQESLAVGPSDEAERTFCPKG